MEKISIDLQKDIIDKKSSFVIKRFFDIILSIIGIILLSPIFLILIVIIKIDSKGPAIYKQTRVGKDSVPFTIYKFRTMVVNADKQKELNLEVKDIGKFIYQSKSDNRVTKVGSFLRKSSLDEIPQLFNVLFGDMSIVGPRPEVPEVVKFYPDQYKQRLLVLPGITGLAQVSGRGEIELEKTIKYDLIYIKNFSIMQDLKIIGRTFTAVFKREGAF